MISPDPTPAGHAQAQRERQAVAPPRWQVPATMPARTKARKRALDLLFESEISGIDVLGLLDQRIAEASPPVSEYAADLVRGVQAHRDRIDELLAAHAAGLVAGPDARGGPQCAPDRPV